MTDWIIPFLCGLGASILSAWGVGGGTLLLLVMTLFLDVDQRTAQMCIRDRWNKERGRGLHRRPRPCLPEVLPARGGRAGGLPLSLIHVLQPQAVTCLVLAAGLVALVEPLEQQRQLLCRDGVPLVPHRHPGLAVDGGDAQIESGALPCDCLLYTSRCV